MNFLDVLIEKVCREQPVLLELSNPKLARTKECISLQDAIHVLRILAAHKCNNDVVITADLGLPIRIEMNGHLLQQEIGGIRVVSRQLDAIREFVDSGLDVSASLAKKCYRLGPNLTIKEITNA